MAAPIIPALIAATAGVVGRYIAKNGIAKAIKKYTKNAITEGKKHYADVIKKDGGKTAEKAANIKKIKPVQAANANSRATLRKGLGIGGAGVATAYELSKDDKKTTTKSSDKAVSGNYAMDESANKPVNKNKTDRPTVTKPKATERTYERYRKEPKPVPKGLREGIAKDKNKVTPKVEDTKKQLMMKEKYSGKDSNVKFNAKGGMMKKYSKGGMTKKGKK
jgi:hypothetical protein